MDSIYFSYDGIKSSDLGIYLVKMDNGFIRDAFLGDREILMDKIVGNETPYVYGTNDSALTYTLQLSCLEGYWTLEKRREIARWLDRKKFCEFFSADYPEKIFYFQYQGGIDLHTNGLQQGYIEVEMLNISPYSYSPVYQEVFDLSTITSPSVIELPNKGDEILKPELWIQKYGQGSVSIKNLSDGGREFLINNLSDTETVYFDNERRHIETDLPLYYRYDDFNGNYLELPAYSISRLQVSGACKLLFKYQFKLKG